MTFSTNNSSQKEGVSSIDNLASILRQDLKDASEVGDQDFIRKVIMPLLNAEQKINIRINKRDNMNDANPKPIF